MTKMIMRVNRGGYWFFSAGDCHSAYRGRDESGDRGSYLGFRPVFRLKKVKR